MRALCHHVKVYRYAEALAGARVNPAPASYLQDDLVVSYRKVRDIDRLHEALGFKMGAIAQFRTHQLIQADVYLRLCLFDSGYRKIVKYLGGQHDACKHCHFIVFHDTKYGITFYSSYFIPTKFLLSRKTVNSRMTD